MKYIKNTLFILLIIVVYPFTWTIGKIYSWMGKRHDKNNRK